MRLLIIFLKRYRYFLLISLFYFLIRLVNLTKLPIFTDEAIYLDWGWKMIHIPGNLYHSLYDAKQPLLMWIFGIFEHFLPDPLFAGRLVSIIFGFFNLLGIYKIASRFFSRSVVIISCLLYIITPIFSYYDRQALMESAIATIGIWSCYSFLRLTETGKIKYAVFLGTILGLGYFIKSSAVIFLLTYLLLSIILFFRAKMTRNILIKDMFFVLMTFFLINGLLFINPSFWKSLPSNSRYVFTFSELVKLPIAHWIRNLWMNVEIIFYYTTPLVFFLGIMGILSIFRKRGELLLCILWFIFGVFLQVIFIRGTSHRYIAPFLPLLVLFSGSYISYLIKKWNRIGILILVATFILPSIITFLQVISPSSSIHFLSKFSSLTTDVYKSGLLGGNGVSDVILYLKEESKKHKNMFIGIPVNVGSLENGISIYFQKEKNVEVGFFDSILYGDSLNKIECIKTDLPFYFVSRDEQLVGMDRFLVKYHVIKIPRIQDDAKTYKTIGVYKLKKCR